MYIFILGINPDTESEFRRIAKNHGVDYDAMCVSDNTECPQNP